MLCGSVSFHCVVSRGKIVGCLSEPTDKNSIPSTNGCRAPHCHPYLFLFTPYTYMYKVILYFVQLHFHSIFSHIYMYTYMYIYICSKNTQVFVHAVGAHPFTSLQGNRAHKPTFGDISEFFTCAPRSTHSSTCFLWRGHFYTTFSRKNPPE